MTTKLFDVAVVGGGPAGLTAAMMLARVHRPTIVFDSQSYRNASAKHVHSLWGGLDGALNSEARASTRKQVAAYGFTHFVDAKVVSIDTLGDEATREYVLKTEGSPDLFRAKRVVLATGVRDILPSIPGLQEAWDAGMGMHCMFCHGHENANKRLVLVTPDGAGAHATSGMLTLTKDITVFTNVPAGKFAQDEPKLAERFIQLKLPLLEGKASRITHDADGVTLHLVNGESHHFDGFIVSPDSEPSAHSSPLFRQLKVEVKDNVHPLKPGIKLVQGLNPMGQTARDPNVSVAGDVMAVFQTVPQATVTGGTAGAGAHFSLPVIV
ncbi:hypothetical protein OC861_006087 [Tilletia horrida]|nr:hypothetical protein OC845_006114 [Tilletia horrida]KAK0560876.1 hypothetical protein OC861_006087 [Tilletia horrida]